MEKLITGIVSLYASENITIDYFDSSVVINTTKNKITINDKSCQKRSNEQKTGRSQIPFLGEDKKLNVIYFDEDKKLFREPETNFILKQSDDDVEVMGKLDAKTNKIVNLETSDFFKLEKLGLKYVPQMPPACPSIPRASPQCPSIPQIW